MKKFFLVSSLGVFIFGLLCSYKVSADSSGEQVAYYQSLGYTCSATSVWERTCTKFLASGALFGYSANSVSPVGYALNGFENSGTDTEVVLVGFSPFIYFHNAPDGDVSVRLRSALDTYLPDPVFNVGNGWKVNVQNGKMSLEGVEQKHLFYELALNHMNLSRNGRNFSSKEEVSAFLRDSDFLQRLGFSDEEKGNSLGYFLPKLEFAKGSKYYYLTILDDASVRDISQTHIDPMPAKVHNKYFAVYPSDVEVATVGDFVFPPVTSDRSDDFTVDITGEFLVDSSLSVFWTN